MSHQNVICNQSSSHENWLSHWNQAGKAAFKTFTQDFWDDVISLGWSVLGMRQMLVWFRRGSRTLCWKKSFTVCRITSAVIPQYFWKKRLVIPSGPGALSGLMSKLLYGSHHLMEFVLMHHSWPGWPWQWCTLTILQILRDQMRWRVFGNISWPPAQVRVLFPPRSHSSF